MKLETKPGKVQVLTPHGVDWAALDSDMMLVALRSLVEGMLALSCGELTSGMEKTLMDNFVKVSRALGAINSEVAELELMMSAVKGRIFNGG